MIEDSEKIELDLNNPIFVFYINVDNMSRQSANQDIENLQKSIGIYKNITTWFVASNETRVDCVYDGKSKIREMEISDLIKEINKRIEILSESGSFDDFKINIRNWRLENVLKEDGVSQK